MPMTSCCACAMTIDSAPAAMMTPSHRIRFIEGLPLLLLDVAFEHLPPHDRAVHVALRVYADTFGAGMIGRRRLHVFDECGDAAVLRAPDADAFLDPRQLVRAGVGARLRIGHVDRVVSGDGDAARPAELIPDIEELAVLIEDLDAVVLAVADEQTPARVHGDRVRLADLSRARALAAPFLQELSGAIEFHDAVVLAVALAVGDEAGFV